MDKNAIAAELAELGQEEARLMRKLAKVQAKRCKLLTGCIPDDLDAPVALAATAPKDGGGK